MFWVNLNNKNVFSLSKKYAVLLIAFLFGNCLLFADGEILFNVHGYFGSVFSSNYSSFPVKTGYGGGTKISYRTPYALEFSAGLDYLILPRETKTSDSLSPASYLRTGIGLGFNIPVGERFSLVPGLNAGIYNLNVSGETKKAMFLGGSLSFVYKINQRFSIEIPAVVEFNRGIFADIGLAPGFTVNLTKMFSDDALVEMEVKEVKPVFPVLYSWYEKNSFGTVAVTNNEDSGITDVSVSFFQSQYMAQPKECARINRIERGESKDVDLIAFFNESMLELIEKVDTQGLVTVSYSVLGQKKEKVFPVTLGIYGRNSMSWDDDRRAAVFVSSKDPAAMLFARHVMSSVRNNLRSGVPQNIQYAMGIFEALDEFGINYVIDPNSSYSDNVGSSSIDFLQYPYQTLMYRGGDCDDLSILTCSLFEAVGIPTAFITIPGHIFIAFDSGIKQSDAGKYFHSLNEYIVSDGEVWVPLEITLSDEGYTKAWRVGAREWYSAARTNEAMLYKMHESWQVYRPVSVPGAAVKFLLPERNDVLARFSDSVDEWIVREISPQIRSYNETLAGGENAGVRNDFGILYVRYALFDEAENQFKIARKLNNDNAVLNTASMYFAKEQYEYASLLYKQIIEKDDENTLAYLGLARCAYELGDYKTCDDAYAVVLRKDMETAAKYAYLGSFETVQGRAFSLSERLENTIWVGSQTIENPLEPDKDMDYYVRHGIGLNSQFVIPTDIDANIPQTETAVEKKSGAEKTYVAKKPEQDTSIAWQKVIVMAEKEDAGKDKAGDAKLKKEISVVHQKYMKKDELQEDTDERPVVASSSQAENADRKEIPEIPAVTQAEAELVYKNKEPLLYERELRRRYYYVQIASFSSYERAVELCKKYPKYPLQIAKSGKYFRVVIGPLTIDECGAVLEKFKSFGFKDAFSKRIE